MKDMKVQKGQALLNDLQRTHDSGLRTFPVHSNLVFVRLIHLLVAC